MTDKELQRLSRRELLEMLLSQTEENEALRQKLALNQTILCLIFRVEVFRRKSLPLS